MASRGGQSGSGAPSGRSKKPDPRVSSNLKYEFGPGMSSEQASEKIYGRVGDVEKEGDREERHRRRRQEKEKEREGREEERDREERHRRRRQEKERIGRERSPGRSSITKTSTRSSTSSNNNSAYSSSNMSTVSDDPTIRVSLRNGGRRMEVNVGSEHSSRKPRSGRLEAPPSPSEDSDETVTPRTFRSHKSTTNKSGSREGNEHEAKPKHSARRDPERPVKPSDSISNVDYYAPTDVTGSSTQTPHPPHSEASTASRSVKPKSDNRKEKEHKVKSNHGARSRDSEDPVAPSHFGNNDSYAPSPGSTMSGSTLTPTKIRTHTSTVSGSSMTPSQISNTTSSRSGTSVYPASTILPPSPSSIESIGSGTSLYPNSDITSSLDRSQASTGSRPAKHSSNDGKGREHEIRSDHSARPRDSRSVRAPSRVSTTSTQESSDHGSGVPEVAKKEPYLVPAYTYGVTKTQSMVPVNLLPKDPSEDSSTKWTPDKISYQPQYTAKPNAYFTHNQSK
ncbi:hypothetical protein BTUL_0041g00580 [Botrytis tulipae]|uniref:Uncharacterized protein n=1 Tax=Botrytis tulipae TaxID=87230 RepID=A0A4Z1EY38_9HELO|nr:hypothetical protein BTUL_0041g00580 [Botrytis tulipae]